jgi:hypothetical protein
MPEGDRRVRDRMVVGFITTYEPKERQVQKELEDTKEVIRIHKSKKCRRHNNQMIKGKEKSNELQNTT